LGKPYSMGVFNLFSFTGFNFNRIFVLNICKQLYRIGEYLKKSNFFFNFSFVPTPGTGRRGYICFDCDFVYSPRLVHYRDYCCACMCVYKPPKRFRHNIRLLSTSSSSKIIYPLNPPTHHYKSCTAITTQPPLRRPFIFIPSLLFRPTITCFVFTTLTVPRRNAYLITICPLIEPHSRYLYHYVLPAIFPCLFQWMEVTRFMCLTILRNLSSTE